MHEELVVRRRWISERRFLHALDFCMVLPGPEAMQLATYLGWLMHRTAGGLLAGGLFILPSFVLLAGLSWGYMAFGSVPAVAGLFAGVKPAVIALVLHAGWRIGRRTIRAPWQLAVACGAVGLTLGGVPYPAIVAAAAAVGWIATRTGGVSTRVPASSGAAHATAGEGTGAAEAPRFLIDDDTPPPAHAAFRWSHLARVGLAGAAAWGLPVAAMAAWLGTTAPLVLLALFFTKAALLGFGGAYAVLPYVHAGIVQHFGWLTSAQMLDGLGLGESTPGPLIIVVVFVGYVAAWSQAMLGAVPPALAGLAGAAGAAWCTFLPSFVFVLGAGPLVEATRRRPALTAPLAGVSAAVVGMIAHLALVLGVAVLWPRGLGALPSWGAVAIAVAALAALRRGIGVVGVVLASAAAGVVLHALP